MSCLDDLICIGFGQEELLLKRLLRTTVLNFLFVLRGSLFWGVESCFTLFIPVLKMYLGAAALECSYRAPQRVATGQNWSLTLQLWFGFKSLLPAPGEPRAARRAGTGGGQPQLSVERRLLCCRGSLPVLFFPSLWDAVPHFVSTSCSR